MNGPGSSEMIACRVLTWNLEWAAPGSSKHSLAVSRLESLAADIVVTTEHVHHVWPAYPHAIDGGADWGYPLTLGRRKVIAWSRTTWRDVRIGDEGAIAGRLVSATTDVAGVGALRVIAVCIPWSDAHVRTGQRNRAKWEEHLSYCAALVGEVKAAVSAGPTIVIGDFNQRIPRVRQPIEVFDALSAALDGLTVVTAGDQMAGRLIDHIAVSHHLKATNVQSWSPVIDGMNISDHSGCAADLVLSDDH